MAAEQSGTPVFEMADVAVRRGEQVVIQNLTWRVHDGECWGISGPVGSGKSTLFEVLMGRHALAAGSLTWPLLDRVRSQGRKVEWASDIVRMVSYREQSRLFSYSDHYYQERYDFADSESQLTLRHYLQSGQNATEDRLGEVAGTFHIREYLDRKFILLSNGQVRRARLARAMLAHPEVLLLDDPFMGLDLAGREDLANLLHEQVRQGQRVLLVAREDMLPDWVTHVGRLDKGTLQVQQAFQKQASVHVPNDPIPPHVPQVTPQRHPQSAIVEFEDVNVAYGGTSILKGVTFQVQAGERWAILGPNGSGKTTMLSLLCGDHPQAYANTIRLFGRQRGTGESIWEVKRRIGLVSPELHLYFTAPMSAMQAVATGFHDVVRAQPITPEQQESVLAILQAMGLFHLQNRRFAQLSTGEQRLILLARALVKTPELLIMDEPFQGLDHAHMVQMRDWLDQHLQPEQTLMFVTHDPAEIPASVEQYLLMDRGKARVASGPGRE